MSTQPALFVETFPGPFVVRERPLPSAPGSGEVVVKIMSAALNIVDLVISIMPFTFARNFHDCPKEETPLVLGRDFAGVIEAVGTNVTTFKVGDRVFGSGSVGLNDSGAFQKYAKVRAMFLSKIPDGLNFDSASSIPLTVTTAAHGLYHNGKMQAPWLADGRGKYAGQPLVVLGGSSGVGQFAIQLAKLSGFSPIITTCSPAHNDFVISLGATHVLSRTATPEEFISLANMPFHTIFDAIGSPENQALSVSLLSSPGKLISTRPANLPKGHGKEIETVFMTASAYKPENIEFTAEMYKALEGLMLRKEIVPNKAEVLEGGLSAVEKGLQRVKDGVSGVKLVVRPQES